MEPPADWHEGLEGGAGSRAMRWAGLLLILGGGLVAAAAWLDLGTARGGGYREALRAADTFEGGAFLAAGVALVVAGVAAWGPTVDRRLRIVGVGSALGGGAVLWLAVAAALTVGREGSRLGEGVDVTLAPGVYLALAGGALSLLGGALALLTPGRPTVPAAPATPWSSQPARWSTPSGPGVAPPRTEEATSAWGPEEDTHRDARTGPPREPLGPAFDEDAGSGRVWDHPREDEDPTAG